MIILTMVVYKIHSVKCLEEGVYYWKSSREKSCFLREFSLLPAGLPITPLK